MANAYTSWIIDAPVDQVWALVRDFNGLPNWNPGIVESVIEENVSSDVVGAVRSLKLANGASGRERLLALDDRRYQVMYNFELAPLPLDNYVGRIELKPLTDGTRTLAIWHSTYDERPDNQMSFQSVLESDVFAGGFRSMATKLAEEPTTGETNHCRQPSPGKVYVAEIIDAPLADVWPVLRALAGIGPWYADLQGTIQLTARPGQVGGQRKLGMDGDLVTETLTGLSDHDHRVCYSVRHDIATSLNYDATVELHPVTMNNTTLVTWTLDWPNADAPPDVVTHRAALKKAFALLKVQVGATNEPLS
ncbi:SRPBCC family protein [Cupriavidus pauculus]|nr:SRPBCC family protein [Cupriavidus pauculus]